MGLIQIATTALALGGAALASPVEPRAVAAKVCDAATTVCWSEYVSPEKIAFRVAIPDTATPGNFSALLQIVAPKAVGWAGLAWGGSMVNNPLAVAWATGTTGIISSRKASSRSYPAVSNDVVYTVLPGSGANSTHWTVTAVAKGASAWGTTKLDPSSTSVKFAYAQAASPPTTPTSADSRFSIHQSRGTFNFDLAAAKNAGFPALVEKLSTKPAA